MNTPTVREFREKLSEWFDTAKSSPVFISRKSDRFVMINESEYLDLKEQISDLKSALISELRNEKTFSADEVFRKKSIKKAN